MSETVQRQMATGAIWMVMFKLVERGLGLISTLILARLLTPGDFGVVAMALSFIFMAELLGAFGFDVAIIQNQSATPDHYNSAWTCNFLLGLSITLLMVALAAPIAAFYRKPELTWVVLALAFGPLLSGLENIGVVAFRKELNFRREFKFQVSRKLIGFAVVVPLAFVLRSYWALVVGILFSKLAGTVISYLMHPFRPHLTLSKFRQLFVFSRWLLMNNVVAFLKERSSDFFIGRLAGPASLGVYNISYELAHLPTTEISAPINRALLPGFAKLSTAAEISSAYANAVGLLALLALPAAGCIFVVAPFLVPVLLGPKWLDAILLMQLLAFNGALLLFHSSICAVLMGRGFPDRVAACNACFTVILLAWLAFFFVFMPDTGVKGAAYAALITSVLCTPIYLAQMWFSLGVAPRVFVKAIARPLLGTAAMVLSLHWTLPAYDSSMGFATALAWLIGASLAALFVYVLAVASLWWAVGHPTGAEQALLTRLRSEVKRLFPAVLAADKPPA